MPDLARRTLGRANLAVAVLGYGAMELRGEPRRPNVSVDDASRILNAVLDSGINYIDTSPDYGDSEEHIGRAIAHRRSEYFLASKCGCLVGAPPAPAGQRNPHVFTSDNVRAGVEQSLRRLRTDYLDVVQFHMSPSRDDLERDGALDELIRLQTDGKVRHLGVSGTLPNLREHIAMRVFDVFQIPYSALQREHETAIAEASAAGGGIVIRGGVARGAPAEWQRAQQGLAAQESWQAAGLDELLGGMSRMEFTLRFTLSLPQLSTTIAGTGDLAHLRDNVAAAANGPLPTDVYDEAKRRLEQAGSKPE